MPPTESLFVLSLSGLLALGLIAVVAAWSWRGWLQLRRHELDLTLGRPARSGAELPAVANRIDLADLRERVKKLEAIAAGVDI